MKVPETQRDTALDTTVMAVTRLRLTDFRSYGSFRFDGDSRPVVLTGPNGAGKTNLLEAVSYLAPGRGLRGARLSDIDRRYGKGGWAVAATVQTQEGSVDIGTGRDAGNTRRTVRISNNPAQSQAALAEFVSVVWLTPQMDRLFTDGASARRRFLDRLVYGFDPSHASRVNAYDHAMRERSRLLKAGRRDSAWLSALENAMAEHGVAVAAARLGLTGRTVEISVAADGPFPRARIAAAGVLEGDSRQGIPRALRQTGFARCWRVIAGWTRSRAGQADRRASQRFGTFKAKDVPARDCSTGEQKALLVSLILANARALAQDFGAPPLLLLDEVAAHLDVERRHALFADILEQGAQAWLTGADATLFDELSPNDAAFYRVQDASMTPLT